MNRRFPDNPNCMMLANELSKMFHNYLRIESDRRGINASYRPIIMRLMYEDGLTQLELCKRTHMSAPTISLTLQKMEIEGLIIRKENENDKRRTNIFITEDGKKLDLKMRSIVDEFDKYIFNNIDLDKLNIAKDVLKKMMLNMESVGGMVLHEKNS